MKITGRLLFTLLERVILRPIRVKVFEISRRLEWHGLLQGPAYDVVGNTIALHVPYQVLHVHICDLLLCVRH